MKKVLFLCLTAVLFSISAVANVNQKLSGSTQLFIAERDGKISLDMEIDGSSLPTRTPLLRAKRVDRVIAQAQEVNGVSMVSAFIHVDPNATAQIESLGVVIQERFKNFVVAMIPVDKIESVAQIAAVKQVNVAQKMNMNTDMALFYTNTYQVADYSNAIASGLPCAFKGEGVVVGVIDAGIDFQHAMFQDANGDTRIKRAFVFDESGSIVTYTSEDIPSLTTDYSGQSHGTHTASIAAGSYLTYNGITYGGMAPGADLVLVGCGEHLYTTYIAMGIKQVFDYADSQNMPAVCNLSLGSHFGPHDGTGVLNEVFAELGGDNPNHIIVKSAGNEGSYSPSIGFQYVVGEASAASPFSTVINGLYNATSVSNINRYYAGYECFYSRTPGQQLASKLHVVNTSTNQILWTSDEITEFTIDDFSGINEYFTGLPEVWVYQEDYSGKYNVIVFTNGMRKKAVYNNRKYALAVSIYPVDGGTCIIDGWEGYGYNLFANYSEAIDGYQFVSGSDDCCIADDSSGDDVITVGAYVSKNVTTDVDGNQYSYSYYTVNDIAYFSSYQTPGYGPTGKAKPDICAPGAIIVAGVNRYDTDGYMSEDYRTDLVCDDPSQPLGCMQGTSMSSPCAAGIIALYLQAAQSVGKSLNIDDIRDIFAHTAIQDQYTTKSNFGPYGKIDALAGIKYILGEVEREPVITTDVSSITIDPTYTGYEGSQTILITGTNLHSDVQLSLSNKYAFALSRYTITPEQAAAGALVKVYFYPTASGKRYTTLEITSEGAETVSIPVSGTGIKSEAYITASPSNLNFETEVGTTVTKTFKVTYARPSGSIMISSVSGDGETPAKDDAASGSEMNTLKASNHSGLVEGLSSRFKKYSLIDSIGNLRRLDSLIHIIPYEPITINSLVLELTGDDCFEISPKRIWLPSIPYSAYVTVTYHPVDEGISNAEITIRKTSGAVRPMVVSLHGSAYGPNGALYMPQENGDLFNNETATVENGITGMSELAMESKIYAEGQNIIIESPVEQSAIICDVSGHGRRVNLHAGHNEIPVNASGFYIVRIREKSTKLMIK